MATLFEAQYQLRRDTAANWTSVNPTLAAGVMGLETDTGLFKIGDGSTAWTSLVYLKKVVVGSAGTNSFSTATELNGGMTIFGEIIGSTNQYGFLVRGISDGRAIIDYVNNGAVSGSQRILFRGDLGSPYWQIVGDLNVTGALSKGSGTFDIKHPIKEGHRLRHSFIEGPTADNIYRGSAKLVGGKAIIDLDKASGMTDGTFEALNTNIQVFTTNETSWEPVIGRVEGSKLYIECKEETRDVISWMVIGTRQDEWMKSEENNTTDAKGDLIVEYMPEVENGKEDTPD